MKHEGDNFLQRKPDLDLICKKKKKRNLPFGVDFGVPTDHRVKMKENEKIHYFWDRARELKKLRSIWIKVILNVVGANEIGGRIETTQTAALLRSARILRRILET